MCGNQVDGEGSLAVSHDWDTKTPVCETSLDKGNGSVLNGQSRGCDHIERGVPI